MQFRHQFLRSLQVTLAPGIEFIAQAAEFPVLKVARNPRELNRRASRLSEGQASGRDAQTPVGVIDQPAVNENLEIQTTLVWARDLLKFSCTLRPRVHFLHHYKKVRYGLGRRFGICRLRPSPKCFRRNQKNESDHQANSRQSQPERAAQQKADDGTAKQHS